MSVPNHKLRRGVRHFSGALSDIRKFIACALTPRLRAPSRIPIDVEVSAFLRVYRLAGEDIPLNSNF